VPDLDITVVRGAAGPVVVGVKGELDVATTPELRECLAGVDGDVVVDLSGVTFMDSTALGALVAATNRSREQGATLMLRGESAFVSRLLKVAGLGDFFHPDGVQEG